MYKHILGVDYSFWINPASNILFHSDLRLRLYLLYLNILTFKFRDEYSLKYLIIHLFKMINIVKWTNPILYVEIPYDVIQKQKKYPKGLHKAFEHLKLFFVCFKKGKVIKNLYIFFGYFFLFLNDVIRNLLLHTIYFVS